MKPRFIISALASVFLLNGQPQRISLEDATQEAIAHNLDLAAARFNISIAEARQITAAVHDDFLPGQDAGVHAAQLDKMNEAVFHSGDHQADLIHVGGQHDRAPRGRRSSGAAASLRPIDSAADGERIAHLVHACFDSPTPPLFQHD